MPSDSSNDRWTERLSEYIDRELESEEYDALRRHLVTCTACSASVIELVAVRRALSADSRTSARTGLWDELSGRLNRRDQLPSRSAEPHHVRGRRAPLLLTAVSVLVLALGVGAYAGVRFATYGIPIPGTTWPSTRRATDLRDARRNGATAPADVRREPALRRAILAVVAGIDAELAQMRQRQLRLPNDASIRDSLALLNDRREVFRKFLRTMLPADSSVDKQP